MIGMIRKIRRIRFSEKFVDLARIGGRSPFGTREAFSPYFLLIVCAFLWAIFFIQMAQTMQSL